MNKLIKYAQISLLGLLLGGIVFSCKKDLVITEVTMTCILPDSLSGAELSNIVLSAKNISTGANTDYSLAQNSAGIYTLQLYEGLYNFSLEANATYEKNGVFQTGTVRGYKESVNITGEQAAFTLNLFLLESLGGFVIAEIFFTGTLTPEGKQ